MNSAGMPGRKSYFLSTRLSAVLIRLFYCGLFCAGNGNAQSLEETQQQFLRGHYAEVIATAQKKTDTGDYRGDWRMLLVKAISALRSNPASQANSGSKSNSGSQSKRE